MRSAYLVYGPDKDEVPRASEVQLYEQKDQGHSLGLRRIPKCAVGCRQGGVAHEATRRHQGVCRASGGMGVPTERTAG
jgi:hypothetical protein